ERALMAGDEETGVTIIELVEELDAGPIAAQQRFQVGIDDDAGVVFARAAELTPDLIDAALDNQQPAPQAEDGTTYAEKIGRGDPRPPRPRVRAAARLRDDPAFTHARLRDRAARAATRSEARPAGSGGAAARRLRARVHADAPARRRERDSRARARGQARASGR